MHVPCPELLLGDRRRDGLAAVGHGHRLLAGQARAVGHRRAAGGGQETELAVADRPGVALAAARQLRFACQVPVSFIKPTNDPDMELPSPLTLPSS